MEHSRPRLLGLNEERALCFDLCPKPWTIKLLRIGIYIGGSAFRQNCTERGHRGWRLPVRPPSAAQARPRRSEPWRIPPKQDIKGL